MKQAILMETAFIVAILTLGTTPEPVVSSASIVMIASRRPRSEVMAHDTPCTAGTLRPSSKDARTRRSRSRHLADCRRHRRAGTRPHVIHSAGWTRSHEHGVRARRGRQPVYGERAPGSPARREPTAA